MKGLIFSLIGLVPSLLWATPAAADPSAAEALFEEGVALSERGALTEACSKFEASEALDVAVGTLLRLADCYDEPGVWHRPGRVSAKRRRWRRCSRCQRDDGWPACALKHCAGGWLGSPSACRRIHPPATLSSLADRRFHPQAGVRRCRSTPAL